MDRCKQSGDISGKETKKDTQQESPQLQEADKPLRDLQKVCAAV